MIDKIIAPSILYFTCTKSQMDSVYFFPALSLFCSSSSSCLFFSITASRSASFRLMSSIAASSFSLRFFFILAISVRFFLYFIYRYAIAANTAIAISAYTAII
ncbi:hypothetical protein EhV213 [Emiliania huxleyi virus 86]|uniref:Putative membrane protein n=1 Tax=Emiliania huxleyi virus 86 (isolate United Kingdom/English Channel/1999) TaxID=654925 RepID=Q4A2R9_EHV8U|nr:hypothetical protein EhV213 [Emiliania huxleyi virus 86]CAI65637.1 putative membrane protein [Emiliania huxleyi virus 86]